MIARRYAAAIAIPFALLSLSGCGERDARGVTTDDPTPAQDGLTPPGTTLQVGDNATVPRTDGTGVIELTITDVTQGESSDLRRIGYNAADQETPFYVKYEMRLVSGEGQGINMRHYLSAWAADSPVGDLIVSQPFATCQEVNFPADASAGTTINSCRTYLVDQGAPPVDTVRFDNEDAYLNGKDTQVEWK